MADEDGATSSTSSARSSSSEFSTVASARDAEVVLDEGELRLSLFLVLVPVPETRDQDYYKPRDVVDVLHL